MKIRTLAFILLILSVLVTILSQMVQFLVLFKFANIVLPLGLAGFFMYVTFLDLSVKESLSDKWYKIASGTLFTVTSTMLAVVQSVKSDLILGFLDILIIANGLFAIYLFANRKWQRVSKWHFLLATVMIGIVAFWQ